MGHPFDGRNSNERDTSVAMWCSRAMPPQTPLRGRCNTLTALHKVSSRQLPARTPTLPMAADTEPDDLLPALVRRAPPPEDALRSTRLDGVRYESFLRKLSEEVVTDDDDSRLEPGSE